MMSVSSGVASVRRNRRLVVQEYCDGGQICPESALGPEVWLRYGGLAETGPWNATGRFSPFPARGIRGKIEKGTADVYSMQENVRNEAAAYFKIGLFFSVANTQWRQWGWSQERENQLQWIYGIMDSTGSGCQHNHPKGRRLA